MSVALRICCFPKRYWVTLLAFIGLFQLELMHVNLSIVVVEMTSNKTIITGNKTEFINADYNWSSVEEGYILSAHSCGVAMSFLCGLLMNKFGGATVFGVGIALTAILDILTPLLLRIHIIIFILCRVLQGLCYGFAITSMVDIFARWSPKEERTRLVSFAVTGKSMSIAINYPLSSYIASEFGWQSTFYISGLVTLIWFVIWKIFVADDPSEDKFISNEEKLYLKHNTAQIINNEKVVIPWKSILSSTAVYALFMEYFTAAWAPAFVANYLPLYIKDVHNVDITSIGLISSVPVWCGVITTPIAASFADYLRSHHLSHSAVHKLFISVGEVLVLIPLIVAALWGNLVVCLICFCVIRIGFSVALTSYYVICIDLAGQFARTIKAICISWNSVGSSINPIVLGYVVTNKTQAEWNVYFSILSAVTMGGIIVFMIFGSGELQHWALRGNDGDIKTTSGTDEMR